MRRLRALGMIVIGLAAVMGLADRACAQEFPWKSGDRAPTIAGVHLGDLRAQLELSLGMASDIQDLAPDSFALFYKERGVIVLYSTHEGATAVYLLTPTAGDVGGVRVGDGRDQILQKWGSPSKVDGSSAIYRARDWVIALQLGPEQTVVKIGVGRPDDKTGELP